MLRSSTARTALAVVLVLVVLGLLRYKPWQRASSPAGGPATTAANTAGASNGRQKLTVGFLPVT